MYRGHLGRFCAPANVQQEAVDQVTSLLSRHPQLHDASVLEEQCARVKAWAQLVVRQSFVVKAEQLRVKQEGGRVSPEKLGIISGVIRCNGREEFRGSLAT